MTLRIIEVWRYSTFWRGYFSDKVLKTLFERETAGIQGKAGRS